MEFTKGYASYYVPENQDVKVWRYMDFAKFVSLLKTRSLFLARLNTLDDKYEGATSHANAYAWSQALDIGDGVRDMSKFMEWARQWVYVNCWHMNNLESEAMWKLYAKNDQGVAIQSRYKTLVNAVDGRAAVSAINYIDYENDIMQEGSIYLPFFHKRRSFEHEKEVRIMVPDLPMVNNNFDRTAENHNPGIKLAIELDEVIESVYVPPYAPTWYTESVAEVIEKFEYKFRVNPSSLSKPPVY